MVLIKSQCSECMKFGPVALNHAKVGKPEGRKGSIPPREKLQVGIRVAPEQGPMELQKTTYLMLFKCRSCNSRPERQLCKSNPKGSRRPPHPEGCRKYGMIALLCQSILSLPSAFCTSGVTVIWICAALSASENNSRVEPAMAVLGIGLGCEK